jgi:hypothetical protein
MRKLGTISGLMILIFLVTAMSHYKDDLTRYLIAIGTVVVAVCLIIIKIPKPGSKQKKKGYILRG